MILHHQLTILLHHELRMTMPFPMIFLCGICETDEEPLVQPQCECCDSQNCKSDAVDLEWPLLIQQAQDHISAKESMRTLPGCSSSCGSGGHCLRTCKAFDVRHDKYTDVSEKIALSSAQGVFNSLNLLTEAVPEYSEIMNVEQEMVWCQVPCAVDSGASGNVSPPNIFGVISPKAVPQKAKYFGADGSPIDNKGQMTINAILNEGTPINTEFDIADITRPLLSVNQIVDKGHQVVFGKRHSYIQLAGSNYKVGLRPEGKLYMLDLWVKIPPDLAQKSPVVRQVSKA